MELESRSCKRTSKLVAGYASEWGSQGEIEELSMCYLQRFLVKLDKILTVECTDCTSFTQAVTDCFDQLLLLRSRDGKGFWVVTCKEGMIQELVDIVVVILLVHCST
jgi:hypothetical protein